MYNDNGNKPWTVKDVIEVLQKMDQNAPIEVALQTYTKSHPSGYFELSWIQRAHNDAIRLWVHLGEGFTISERKKRS